MNIHKRKQVSGDKFHAPLPTLTSMQECEL